MKVNEKQQHVKNEILLDKVENETWKIVKKKAF